MCWKGERFLIFVINVRSLSAPRLVRSIADSPQPFSTL
jgi:hypothetical protein